MEGVVPRVRGLSLTHWLESFEELNGPDRLAELRARLPPEATDALARGLDPQGWYPVAWFRAACAAGREVTGGDDELIARVARSSARAEFSGIHRILLLFVSPQRLLKTGARLFERYYTEGRVSTEARGPSAAEVRWTGCREFDANLWRDCWHATAVAIEMCGARDVRFEAIAGGGDGDQDATVVYRWR